MKKKIFLVVFLVILGVLSYNAAVLFVTLTQPAQIELIPTPILSADPEEEFYRGVFLGCTGTISIIGEATGTPVAKEEINNFCTKVTQLAIRENLYNRDFEIPQTNLQ